MGAWIEIELTSTPLLASSKSLPSWERGLKYFRREKQNLLQDVAPFMGAWIEICLMIIDPGFPASRSLHGSVD